jgi:hypothetical protein
MTGSRAEGFRLLPTPPLGDARADSIATTPLVIPARL